MEHMKNPPQFDNANPTKKPFDNKQKGDKQKGGKDGKGDTKK